MSPSASPRRLRFRGVYTKSYIAFTSLEPIQALTFGLEGRGNYLEGTTKLQLNQSAHRRPEQAVYEVQPVVMSGKGGHCFGNLSCTSQYQAAILLLPVVIRIYNVHPFHSTNYKNVYFKVNVHVTL